MSMEHVKTIRPNRFVKKAIVVFPVLSMALFFAIREESSSKPNEVIFDSFSVERTDCGEREYFDYNGTTNEIRIEKNVKKIECRCRLKARYRVAKSAESTRVGQKGFALKDWKFWPFVRFEDTRWLNGFTSERSLFGKRTFNWNSGLERFYGISPDVLSSAINSGTTSGSFIQKPCKVTERAGRWDNDEIQRFSIFECDRESFTVSVSEYRGPFYGFGLTAAIFWALCPVILLFAVNLFVVLIQLIWLFIPMIEKGIASIWNWTNR